jgi:DNA-directed RNA polymerase specialized sigma24 family protein
VEGYSAREIGELVGRPRGTILSMAHRARQRMRELLRVSAVGNSS